MSKRVFIFREPSTKITLHAEYMHVKNIYYDKVIALRHIEMVYLSKSIEISMATCYELSTHVPLYIIDNHGYILAELKCIKDA